MEVIKRFIEINDPNPPMEYRVALPTRLCLVALKGEEDFAKPPRIPFAAYRLVDRPTRTRAVYELDGVEAG